MKKSKRETSGAKKKNLPLNCSKNKISLSFSFSHRSLYNCFSRCACLYVSFFALFAQHLECELSLLFKMYLTNFVSILFMCRFESGIVQILIHTHKDTEKRVNLVGPFLRQFTNSFLFSLQTDSVSSISLSLSLLLSLANWKDSYRCNSAERETHK